MMERGQATAARSGASFGVAGAVLGFSSIFSVTLSHLLGSPFGFVVLFGCALFLLMLFVLAAAGAGPARVTGRAASGAGAGALAGALTGVGVLIGLLVDGTQNGAIGPPPSSAGGLLGYGLGVLILLAGLAALFAALGAGLGALGGLIGRGQATQQFVSPPAYPYPGPPPHGQGRPPYPQYPGGPMGWPEYPPYSTGPSNPPLPPYDAPPN